MILYTKQQLNTKINELKAYCKSNKPKPTTVGATGTYNWDGFLSPLYTAINNYFDADLLKISGEINFMIQGMYVDIQRRNAIYENDDQFDFNHPINYPVGYSDVTECFYDFSPIMNTSNNTFLASCSFGESETGEPTISSEVLDGWVEEINVSRESEYQNIFTLGNWCADSGYCCDLINLLEDRGKIVSIKGRREIAEIIYINRKVLEVIRFFGLSSYIPTYYQEV